MLRIRPLANTIGLILLFALRSLAQVPLDAASDFRKAVDLFQKQHFPQALVLVQELRKEYPDNFEILHLSGMLLDLNHRPKEANQAFARAVELNPDSDLARTNLGVSCLRLGQPDEALEQFQAAFQLNPRNATAAFNLGALFLQRQELQQAADWFQKAFDLQPDVYQNGYQLALVRFLLSQHQQAAQVLDQLRPRVPDGVLEFQLLDVLNQRALAGASSDGEALDLLIQKLGSHPELVPQVSDLLLGQGLLDEAEQLLQQSVQAAGNFQLWVKLAEVQFRQGELEAALDSAGKAGRFQESAGLHLLSGDILEAMDRSIEALEHYRHAVELEPSDETYYALGYELLAHWNWEEAEVVFETATQRFPDSWRLWLGLGTARWGQGKDEPATRNFLESAGKGSGQPIIYQMLSLSFVGAEDSFSDAVQTFRDYQAGQPSNPWALYYRALAEVELGKREGTSPDLKVLVPWLQQAAASKETEAPARFLLGELYFGDQEWKEAIEAFEKGLAIDANQVDARYKLGLALQRAGFRQRALEELQRYQELKDKQESAMGERISRTRKFIIDMKRP